MVNVTGTSRGKYYVVLSPDEQKAFDRWATLETTANAHRPWAEGTFMAGTGEVRTAAELIQRTLETSIEHWLKKVE